MKQIDRFTNGFFIGFLLILSLVIGVTDNAVAQKTSVRATIQPAEIMIGEQAVISLEVITPKNSSILFPMYEKYMVEGLEVLGAIEPDTTINLDVMTLNVRYVVTSFDSTLYYIPSIPVSDGKDTIYSNPIGLKVISPQLKETTKEYLDKINAGETDSIDFVRLELYDIKPLEEVPYSFGEIMRIVLIVLVILLLIVGMIVAIIKLIRRKKKKGYIIFEPEPLPPPHIIAISALNKIKEEKLWTKGLEKEFYTQLTDVIRVYISHRFGFNAMEETSAETLEKIKNERDAKNVESKLRDILLTADLVKFAKYKPYQNDNDRNIANAYIFIEETKKEVSESEKDEELKNEVKNVSNKLLTKEKE